MLAGTSSFYNGMKTTIKVFLKAAVSRIVGEINSFKLFPGGKTT